ncbi:MAG TPA: ABC transporter ATP-binding protein [Fimbriimonadaceae bacterium]|nr:ABC transporter ATP-binding protein [Fimbriimonadaceae bacterium]
MSEVSVSVRDLHKSFELSHTGAASLKTTLLWWKRKKNLERIDVLRGVSFDLHRGECLSLVGRNGAGKSTLLALVARVYRPTSGEIETHGRVAPLLELGAGFHPDLSGQENVVFNAMMLGLSRKQANERLDQIVEFSGLGRFISAPVRTYSSGMQARLGFAVAINVDADVLIVDEVLAVGDIAFEHKCFNYIEGFRSRGGSILLVTHNLVTIEKFADRTLWLQDGLVAKEGLPSEVIPYYRQAMEGPQAAP